MIMPIMVAATLAALPHTAAAPPQYCNPTVNPTEFCHNCPPWPGHDCPCPNCGLIRCLCPQQPHKQPEPQSDGVPACSAACWILVGVLGLLCFAPIAWAARRLMASSARAARAVAHGAMITAQIIFGAGTVLVGGRMKAHPIDPVVFALVREVMAAVALGTAAVASGERRLPARADLRRIGAVGTAVWATNLLFIYGEDWVSKANAASVGTLMQPCLPVVTTLMAIAIGYERASMAKLAGIAVAIAGSLLVVILGELSSDRGSASGSASSSSSSSSHDSSTRRLLTQGTLALLAQAFANASYILLQRPLLQPPRSYPVLSLTAWGFAVAAVCMGVFSAITPGWHPTHHHQAESDDGHGGWDLPNAAWLPIVYWVFAGSCVGYSCGSLANSVLPASVVSAYVCLQPLVGVVFSWLLNHERPAWRDTAGLLIIAGLLITSFSPKHARTEAARHSSITPKALPVASDKLSGPPGSPTARPRRRGSLSSVWKPGSSAPGSYSSSEIASPLLGDADGKVSQLNTVN
jgi:drug/metabolite transporter (DMT)-like permease